MQTKIVYVGDRAEFDSVTVTVWSSDEPERVAIHSDWEVENVSAAAMLGLTIAASELGTIPDNAVILFHRA